MTAASHPASITLSQKTLNFVRINSHLDRRRASDPCLTPLIEEPSHALTTLAQTQPVLRPGCGEPINGPFQPVFERNLRPKPKHLLSPPNIGDPPARFLETIPKHVAIGHPDNL